VRPAQQLGLATHLIKVRRIIADSYEHRFDANMLLFGVALEHLYCSDKLPPLRHSQRVAGPNHLTIQHVRKTLFGTSAVLSDMSQKTTSQDSAVDLGGKKGDDEDSAVIGAWLRGWCCTFYALPVVKLLIKQIGREETSDEQLNVLQLLGRRQ
ncbi:hypothetical protein BKA81DRAFT_428811, partial [Phyllosticta paracitricarpa]